jgi:hypothetical protein
MHAAAQQQAAPDRVVAPEFVGKARAFRARILDAALVTGPLMRAATDDAFRTYARRNSGPRPEYLIDLERRWRAIPSTGCLALSIGRDRREMTLVDVRLTGGVGSNSQWGPDAHEMAICIVENTLTLTKRAAETKNVMLGALSLHALGRWHARCVDPSEAALLRDITLIANAAPAELSTPAGCAFKLPTNGGAWFGSITALQDRPNLLNVRTFAWT